MTYMLEMSGGRWTTFVGIGVEFYWVAGWLSLGTFAYFITDWRKLLLVTSIPGKHHFIVILPGSKSPSNFSRILHSLVLLDHTRVAEVA